MGLANTLGWTGVDNFISPRRNTLTALGASLLSGKPGVGVSEGIQADSAFAIQQKAEQERQANINQTAEWLQNNYPEYAGLPPEQGWQLAMKDQGGGSQPASIQEYQFYSNQELSAGRAPKPYDEWRQGSNQGDFNTGFTPIPGTFEGKDVFAFPGNDGRYYVDGQPVPAGAFKPTSQYVVNANKAAGTMFGKQTGDAQFDVPSAQLTVNQTVDALKEIRDNKQGMAEQFGNILGLPTQMIPARPGTSMADFRNSVTRGANLAFMQAREMLRGGGQITDFESKKAESAITDMQIAMESGSQPMFEKALDDFEQAVKDGYEKLKSQASVIPGYGDGGPAPAGGGDLKSKYGLE
jgi:hypothetical protein